MDEDTEYKKLPVEERCVHKLWKARVDGYEEATKIFRSIDDEKSPEWNKFLGLVKKFVIDSNAVAQEKGLEATLIFVENSANAGKTVGETMSGIVQKCIAAPKTKTKELSVQITLMYIEIEKQEAVMEELLKGMEHKNPKIVAACTACATLALREFGSKVIGVKPLIKKLAPLMSDRDKSVRDEGKQLAIEIFRWIGAAMKPQIASLPQVTINELESEFVKLTGEKAEPTRYLRSQQEKQQAVSAAAVADGGDDGDDFDGDGGEEIDPMDLIDPVDILSKLPKDFYEKLEAKKWQERKESLEALEKLLENPKLESGDYGDVVRALKKVLTKDTNVILVAMAGKCMASLAKGLGKRYSTYASACIPAIFEKFKEKKANVVAALRDAIDAIYPSTSLESMQEDIVEALNNKNPSVKAETASFLARAFTKTQPTSLNKKLLKVLVTSLLKTLNEPDPTVRDCAAEALGTLLKLMGEKTVGVFLTEVDALKMAKIKECQEKAVITIKIAGSKKERPATAPTVKSATVKAGSADPKPVSRPATAAGAKKAPVKKDTQRQGGGGTGNSIAKSASSSKVVQTEKELTPEEVSARAEELLTPDILSGLVDSNWKTRLAAVENFQNQIGDFDIKTPNIAQILVRTLSQRKPGLKEMNFQVLKIKLDIIKIITEKFTFTTTTADFIMNEVTEKLADPKNGVVAAQLLTSIAEIIKLDYVVSKVISFAFEQKSPKVQSEGLNWTNQAIKEFGFQVNPKLLIDDIKKGVQSTNPTVRTAAISLCGSLAMYMGNTILIFFDNEKPAVKSIIEAEVSKNLGQKPPAPIRGVKKSSSLGSVVDEEDDDTAAGGGQEPMNIADLLPRVDISSQITESLLAEIADKNWKTRNEGLIKLQSILNDAKLIKPSIGDLPQALAPRLGDSNAKIAQTAFQICEQLATAMGPACKTHVLTLFPMFLHGLGDNKVFIRQSSLACINTWGDQCGYKDFFTNEMIADSLKTGSPALKTELWGWLAEKLPNIPVKAIPKDEIVAMLPHLYANICDRNADVRKNANEAVLGIMIHIGFESMVKALDKQKPASKKDIQAALDKARPNLPVKPLPKGKQQAPILEEVVKTKVAPGKTIKSQSKIPEKPVSSRKKEEDVDTSPLLVVNSTKNQRLIDEQKMRVLRWSFTTPREEFIELLKEQMSTANVNKGLMANMFHDDFRYHLKVIEALVEDVQINSKALICNLDLVLKWLSLRFYDTNPSVLLKGLEYLNIVFQMLTDQEYILAENEGSAFIPHLLTKIGDPKDAVRNGVRSLLRQICCVYPFAKVFVYVMDGLKSKNARQRTECLDELGYLIETYTLSICQPTPQAALKEIARHISDRDNSVRNAALNCVVQAYFLAGDKIYKLIGQMNEKDLSMLDERIKRAKKTRKPTPVVEAVKVQPMQSEIEIEDNVTDPADDELPPPDESNSPSAVNSSMKLEDKNGYSNQEHTLKRQATFDQPSIQQMPHKPSGPFGLDPQVIADIEKDWVKSDQMKQVQVERVDLSFMDEPIRIVSKDGVGYPQDKFDKLISQSHNMIPQHNTSSNNIYTMSPSQPVSAYTSRTNQHQPQQNLADTLLPNKLDPALVKIIQQIAHTDTLTARAAMTEIGDILESPDKQAALRDYEEMFIQSVATQFKNLSQIPINESLIIYQPLLSITYAFFNSKTLGRTLGVSSLKNIMSVLLGLMADQRLSVGDDGQYTKVINGICLKILDRTNFTNLNCALIRLLKETCPSAGLPKFTDLLMKCIWRNVKMMTDRSNELDYDAVLMEVHEFMLALPSSWWLQRPSDTPLRTVKTIIHNMTKIKGNAILQHLNKIPSHSELHAYLIKILKNIQKDGGGSGVSPQRSNSGKDIQAKRFSNQTHETMTQIFKLISDKETSKQGFNKLYEFKVENPEVDVAPFLKGASPCFQKYIEDGLAELERQYSNSNNSNNQNNANGDNKYDTKIMPSTNRPGNKLDPDYWMEKLSRLRAKGNLNSSKNDDINHLIDNKVADENLNLNQIQTKVSLIRKDKPELSPNRLEHLQQKLAQIKQQKQS
ncbi:protein mini spindles isoform X2 [Condylostylus longicornis]|uniref:protein mini spindles isoform X2 n=1 Tax=Condylostylus longicornis TaxID=2530218 RepID=UPI00244DC270|nr:protein mini spindles isoform X2 [Condylostylus longicornis]